MKSNPHTLKLNSDLAPSDLKQKLDQWAPWGHRIEFSNGVTTADCERRVPFSDGPLHKMFIAGQFIPFEGFRGGRVLDIGCNSGYNSIHCAANFGMRATGIDVTQRHLDVANFLTQVAGVTGDYKFGNAETYLEEAQFDVVLHFGTLYHLKNPLLSLDTTFSNLKSGGFLALETQVYDDPKDEDHCYFMHMHNNDPTNFWALSTKVLRDSLSLSGFVDVKEVLKATPPQLATHMSRKILIAQKP